MTTVVVKWLADDSGTAHAHVRRAVRTACQKPVIDPRFAWPQLRLCQDCVAAIKREALVS